MHRTGTKHIAVICKNLSYHGPSYPSSPVIIIIISDYNTVKPVSSAIYGSLDRDQLIRFGKF